MKYKISKERFNEVSKKLLKYFFGELHFFNNGFKTKDYKTAIKKNKEYHKRDMDYIEVFNSDGSNIIDIWMSRNMTGKRCKSLTMIHTTQLDMFENFLPIMRKKEFSKVLSDYFYEQLNFKADCIDFAYSYEETFNDEGESDGYDYKDYRYRPNKKKKR